MFTTVVHVKKRKKVRTSSGIEYKLICPHQSSNLLTKTVSKPNRRTSGKVALTDIVNQLNDPSNKAVNDPTIVIKSPFEQVPKNGIRLNPATSNDYIFEAVKAEQAINEIIEKEANVPEAGGAFEWHYFRFQSLYVHPNDADIDNVAIQVFEQGFKDNSGVFNNTPSVTIKKAVLITDPSTPLLETDSSLEVEQGTNLIAIGHKTSGSYPVEYMKFQGAKDTFRGVQLWFTARDYVKGNLVTDDALVFECTGAHTSDSGNRPPDTTFWIQRLFIKPALWSSSTTYGADELVHFIDRAYKSLQAGNLNHQPDTSPTFWVEVRFVPAVDYSPLTKDKAQYWINALAGYASAGTLNNNKTGVVDHNIIIKDDKHNRTWVDVVSLSDVTLQSQLLRSGSPFDTLRVLVNGTGIGRFATADPNGVSFNNAVAEFRDDPGQGGPDWFVFRTAQVDDEVFDFREGESYTFQPCEGGASFVDSGGACNAGSRNSGWVKGAYFLEDIIGIGLRGHFEANEQFDCHHPLRRNATTGDIEVGNEKIINEDGSTTSAVFFTFDPSQFGDPDDRHPYSYFMGANFTMLWPRNSNSIPFGAVTLGEKIDLEVLDFFNMHLTHLRKREWFGPGVEDYFPIQGFAWFEKVVDEIFGGTINPTGDYSMSLWLADRNDNKVTMDFTHSVNNIVTPQDTPISKAKTQRSIPGINTFAGGKVPEVLDIFDWRNVVRGGIESKDVFDEQGRYKYTGKPITSKFPINNRFFATTKLKLSLDGFRMIKPLVATNVKSATKPIRNIEPKKLRQEGIVSYAQLKNFVESNEFIFNFQRDEFPLKTELRCNIKFGDPVYYEDNEIIDETTDAKPNTIKAVADKIIYSISKPSSGPGGFLRTVDLITRIWPT